MADIIVDTWRLVGFVGLTTSIVTLLPMLVRLLKVLREKAEPLQKYHVSSQSTDLDLAPIQRTTTGAHIRYKPKRKHA